MLTPISGTFLNVLRSLLPAPGADLGSFVSHCLLLLLFPVFCSPRCEVCFCSEASGVNHVCCSSSASAEEELRMCWASVLLLGPARTFRLLDVTTSLKLLAQSHIYV